MKKFLLMLGGICSLFIFAGCSESPADAVAQWGAGIILGDEETAAKFSTEDSKLGNKLLIKRTQEDAEYLLSFTKELEQLAEGEVVIEGDRAEIKIDGKIKMVLKKVNDKWLVDLAGLDASKENGYSPKEVVTRWAKAIVAGDKATADKYVTAAGKIQNEQLLETCKQEAAKKQIESFISQIPDEAEIIDDFAVVKFGHAKLTLKKINGNWIIDFSAVPPAKK